MRRCKIVTISVMMLGTGFFFAKKLLQWLKFEQKRKCIQRMYNEYFRFLMNRNFRTFNRVIRIKCGQIQVAFENTKEGFEMFEKEIVEVMKYYQENFKFLEVGTKRESDSVYELRKILLNVREKLQKEDKEG